MRVASFPGGEDALNLGRVPSTSAERARFPIGEGASPVDVAASAANGEPVSPSSRNQKKHLQHSESMAFDMLFDSMDGGAPDMEDIEEGEEDYGDSDQDAHDPVSVYVRYATRGPARPTPREASTFFVRASSRDSTDAPFRDSRTAKIGLSRPMADRYPKNPKNIRRRRLVFFVCLQIPVC
jgi:hypothetical protein